MNTKNTDNKGVLNKLPNGDHFSTLKYNLSIKDSKEIDKILSEVSLHNLQSEIGYTYDYYNNKAKNRLNHRIKFRVEWFLESVK